MINNAYSVASYYTIFTLLLLIQDDNSVRCILVQILSNGKFNLLKPTGHVMHQQFNIQQLYALPTLCLYVLYLSENKQRLVPLTA